MPSKPKPSSKKSRYGYAAAPAISHLHNRKQAGASATKILIIEDDPDTIAILKMFFKKEGYDIDVAGDGQEGFDKLKKDRHDLVLSDVMMPKMDGFRFCELVRSETSIKMTPIILVTAKNDPRDKIVGLEKGADDYITKPYHLIELRVRIASMLKLKKLRTELLNKEKELERIKTLEQTLIAISHHINNATAPIAGRAQICDVNDPESVKKLIDASISGCRKITGTIELLAQVIKLMKSTNHEEPIDFSELTVNDLLTKFEEQSQS